MSDRSSEIVMNQLQSNCDIEKCESVDSFPSRSQERMRWSGTENNKFKWFLILTGSYWVGDNSCRSRLNPINWTNMLIRVLLCIGSAYMLFQLATDIMVDEEYPIVLTTVFFFSIVSVIPAQYFNLLRMAREPFNFEDSAVRSECINISLFFGLISFVPLLVGLIFGTLGSPLLLVLIVLAMLVLLYLMSSLFFLMVDLRVSLLLLDQLHTLADARMLTVETYHMVRDEVNRRATASKIASDFILIPCIFSVVGIVFTVLNLDQGNLGVFDSVGVILGLSKELFFTAFSFYYVAKVNARADELTVKLGKGFWGTYNSTEQSTHGISIFKSIDINTATSRAFSTENVQIADLHRLSMHASSVSDPISFTLIFKRVSWQNVAVSALSLSVTIMVGVIKSIVGF